MLGDNGWLGGKERAGGTGPAVLGTLGVSQGTMPELHAAGLPWQPGTAEQRGEEPAVCSLSPSSPFPPPFAPTRPEERRQPTVLTRPHPGNLNALLLLAGGHLQFTLVVVGEAIAPTHLSEGLPLAARAHALPTHALAAKGAHRAAAGLCGARGRNHGETS